MSGKGAELKDSWTSDPWDPGIKGDDGEKGKDDDGVEVEEE